MSSVLASSVVDHGFEPRLGKIKEYKIDIFCFCTKQATLKSNTKGWLDQNQNNVSVWSDMSTHRLLFY